MQRPEVVKLWRIDCTAEHGMYFNFTRIVHAVSRLSVTAHDAHFPFTHLRRPVGIKPAAARALPDTVLFSYLRPRHE